MSCLLAYMRTAAFDKSSWFNILYSSSFVIEIRSLSVESITNITNWKKENVLLWSFVYFIPFNSLILWYSLRVPLPHSFFKIYIQGVPNHPVTIFFFRIILAWSLEQKIGYQYNVSTFSGKYFGPLATTPKGGFKGFKKHVCFLQIFNGMHMFSY